MRWREAELIHQWLVVFLLYLRPVGTGELPSVAARCTQTATLPCTARRQVMQSYRAVSWYKVGEATLSGIIRKAGNEMIRYKHFNGNAMITENDSLVIARVTEDDAGIYRCSLLAPLGGMNQDGDVTLSGFQKNEASKSGESRSRWEGGGASGTIPEGTHPEGFSGERSEECESAVTAGWLGPLCVGSGTCLTQAGAGTGNSVPSP
ncbi:uncharacterized protein LOC122559896 isoform X3 [Chiloscyllium plagiosum]|uniref:uncharacterized protein LOC122559896 isoform X3 n=1 Tax=Chiloscyllium plagiosum TaxID=36176 RepID=UPI001CB81F1E|nr:uncharacterized protein LOC122559896 isoform X3 [Chiloscyllium plagiosum]